MKNSRSVNILGTRGVPASHGGFETFVSRLAPYLVERGWYVTVYCQHDRTDGAPLRDGDEDEWCGVRRVHFSAAPGPVGTMAFDWKATRHSLSRRGIDLVLGYNTALFTLRAILNGRKVVMNMDGIEWKREKWSLPAKSWFLLNELVGMHTCSVPVADNPGIERHLRNFGCNRAVVIPYGADRLVSFDDSYLDRLGLERDRFFVSIARIEPENSILDLVTAFSARPRRSRLVVLGKLDENNSYHRRVRAAASAAVIFPGAIYEKECLSALRVGARAYLHGHKVGGTNPSLVEALGAGSAVIAHDNAFNRWTAGAGQSYFADVSDCDRWISLFDESDDAVASARAGAVARYEDGFSWDAILAAYEGLLERVHDGEQ